MSKIKIKSPHFIPIWGLFYMAKFNRVEKTFIILYHVSIVGTIWLNLQSIIEKL